MYVEDPMEADYKGKASYKFTQTTRRNEDREDEFGSGISYLHR
jgi:hypothetical protein